MSDLVVLIDLYYTKNNIDSVLRISDQPFLTAPNDSPPNAAYSDVLKGGVHLFSSLGVSRQIGEIEFFITDFDREGVIWSNYKIFTGGSSESIGSFSQIADGLIKRMRIISRGVARFELSDKSSDLEVSLLSEEGDVLMPFFLGTVYNASPVFISETASRKIYRVNNHACSVVAVRANGEAEAFIDLGGGEFSVSIESQGTITCDGADANNTVIKAVEFLAAKQGLVVENINNILDSQLNTGIGYYVKSATTIKKAINEICSSVGIFLRFNELGQLGLVGLEGDGVVAYFHADDIIQYGFSQTRVRKKESASVLYARNWTKQGVDGYEDLYKNTRQYKPLIEPIEHRTLITTRQDADIEMLRRGAVASRGSEVWRVKFVLHKGVSIGYGDKIYIGFDGMPDGVYTVSGISKRFSRRYIEAEIVKLVSV